MLLTVSAAHRHLAMRQFFIQQIVTWATVIALLIANVTTPAVSAPVDLWFLVYIVTWVIRMVLFYPLYRIPPNELAKRKLMRFFPLLTGIIGNAFWIWTIPLFSGPDMHMQQLIMCAGFFCISIAMTGMWPVTPITSLTYYFVLWGTFSYNLWKHNHATWLAIAALNVLVILMLVVYVQASIGQVQAQIRRGEELDAANNELKVLKDQAMAELEHRSSYFQYASHDLRQRLHAIRLWVSSAMDVAKGNKLDSYPLARVGDQVDDLEGYFSKILDFARMEALKVPMQPALIRVHTLLQLTELRFEHLAIESRIDLRVRHSKATAYADQSMLLRIMENLVENAVTAWPRHPIQDRPAAQRGRSYALTDLPCGVINLQTVVASANTLPSGPTKVALARTSRPSVSTTSATARTRWVPKVSILRYCTLRSTVKYPQPGSSVVSTAEPSAESRIELIQPPLTVPIGFSWSAEGVPWNVALPGSTAIA